MTTFQTQFLSELAAGHDGPPIPVAKRAYFQERLRGIFFDFIINKFLREQPNGLTKAKLARRIGKAPEVVNRLLGAPSNMTIDTMSELLIGIAGEEFVPQSESLLHRTPINHSHFADMLAPVTEQQGAQSAAKIAGTIVVQQAFRQEARSHSVSNFAAKVSAQSSLAYSEHGGIGT